MIPAPVLPGGMTRAAERETLLLIRGGMMKVQSRFFSVLTARRGLAIAASASAVAASTAFVQSSKAPPMAFMGQVPAQLRKML
jgi:hypothetical protein